MRVTLRLCSATDVALTGEALPGCVGKVVAEDARRESAQVCLPSERPLDHRTCEVSASARRSSPSLQRLRMHLRRSRCRPRSRQPKALLRARRPTTASSSDSLLPRNANLSATNATVNRWPHPHAYVMPREATPGGKSRFWTKAGDGPAPHSTIRGCTQPLRVSRAHYWRARGELQNRYTEDVGFGSGRSGGGRVVRVAAPARQGRRRIHHSPPPQRRTTQRGTSTMKPTPTGTTATANDEAVTDEQGQPLMISTHAMVLRTRCASSGSSITPRHGRSTAATRRPSTAASSAARCARQRSPRSRRHGNAVSEHRSTSRPSGRGPTPSRSARRAVGHRVWPARSTAAVPGAVSARQAHHPTTPAVTIPSRTELCECGCGLLDRPQVPERPGTYDHAHQMRAILGETARDEAGPRSGTSFSST